MKRDTETSKKEIFRTEMTGEEVEMEELKIS